jgi:hypothetical protein
MLRWMIRPTGKDLEISGSDLFQGTSRKHRRNVRNQLRIEQSCCRLKDTNANISIRLLGFPQWFDALLMVLISLPHSGVLLNTGVLQVWPSPGTVSDTHSPLVARSVAHNTLLDHLTQKLNTALDMAYLYIER